MGPFRKGPADKDSEGSSTMVIKSGHMTGTITERHCTDVYIDDMVARNSYILQPENHRNGLEQRRGSDIVRTDQRFTQTTDWQRPQEEDFNSAGNKKCPPLPHPYSTTHSPTAGFTHELHKMRSSWE